MDNHILDLGDITPKDAIVQFGGKKYKLIEASAGAVCKYHNTMTRTARMEDGKVTSMGDMADAEPQLVADCLLQLREDGAIAGPVPLATVRTWPNRIVRPLFENIKEMSDIGLPDNIESLEKQIASLQKKVKELRKADPTKSSPNGTTSTIGGPSTLASASVST